MYRIWNNRAKDNNEFMSKKFTFDSRYDILETKTLKNLISIMDPVYVLYELNYFIVKLNKDKTTWDLVEPNKIRKVAEELIFYTEQEYELVDNTDILTETEFDKYDLISKEYEKECIENLKNIILNFRLKNSKITKVFFKLTIDEYHTDLSPNVETFTIDVDSNSNIKVFKNLIKKDLKEIEFIDFFNIIMDYCLEGFNLKSTILVDTVQNYNNKNIYEYYSLKISLNNEFTEMRYRFENPKNLYDTYKKITENKKEKIYHIFCDNMQNRIPCWD